MAERVLCEGDLRVSLDGGGGRTLVAVTNGVTVRFWTDTTLLEGTLEGHPVQLSAPEGYCRIEVTGDQARLAFGLDGEGARSCAFPAAELRDALGWVQSLGDPGER